MHVTELLDVIAAWKATHPRQDVYVSPNDFEALLSHFPALVRDERKRNKAQLHRLTVWGSSFIKEGDVVVYSAVR